MLTAPIQMTSIEYQMHESNAAQTGRAPPLNSVHAVALPCQSRIAERTGSRFFTRQVLKLGGGEPGALGQEIFAVDLLRQAIDVPLRHANLCEMRLPSIHRNATKPLCRSKPASRHLHNAAQPGFRGTTGTNHRSAYQAFGRLALVRASAEALARARPSSTASRISISIAPWSCSGAASFPSSPSR